MRLRTTMLCAALSAIALLAAPGLASAAPQHNNGLTIAAAPNPNLAGEPVLIYGQLKGSNNGDQTIVLYHHISGTHTGYTVIQTTKTTSNGYYYFYRKLGVVSTNRSWFTRLQGHPGTHSRTVYERVYALVSLSASNTNPDTLHKVRFYGHVAPNHRGERVALQRQTAGDDWSTIAYGRLGPGSNYSINYRFATPGARTLRVVFGGDDRNIRSASDPVTVTVQQTQRPGFTISTTTPVISYGQSATITGTLDQQGTTTPEGNTPIQLCYRLADQKTASCNTAGNTQNNGSYSFTVSPTNNAIYYVRVTLQQSRRTADLFIGVKDVITLSASSNTGTVGKPDTFSGTVTPDKTGHVVYLQRLGVDGDWHNVGTGHVQSNGTYSISHVFGTPGTKKFRTRILGGEFNLGAASAPVTVTVTQPMTASLPAAT